MKLFAWIAIACLYSPIALSDQDINNAQTSVETTNIEQQKQAATVQYLIPASPKAKDPLYQFRKKPRCQ